MWIHLFFKDGRFFIRKGDKFLEVSLRDLERLGLPEELMDELWHLKETGSPRKPAMDDDLADFLNKLPPSSIQDFFPEIYKKRVSDDFLKYFSNFLDHFFDEFPFHPPDFFHLGDIGYENGKIKGKYGRGKINFDEFIGKEPGERSEKKQGLESKVLLLTNDLRKYIDINLGNLEKTKDVEKNTYELMEKMKKEKYLRKLAQKYNVKIDYKLVQKNIKDYIQSKFND